MVPGDWSALKDVKTVGIIGAGVAGLATAKVLAAEGLHCTLFERNSTVGGVWADGYSNFGVQVQKELYEFPEYPLPEGTPDFTPGPIVQKYLTDYADGFGITPHIRFNTTVVSVEERVSSKPGWILTYREGNALQRNDFDLIVVCIGLYSNVPYLPVFPGCDSFRGEIMHISAVKRREQLKGKRVAVVGFGKSATDAAVESAAVAAETSIIFRTPHWPVPRKLAGILPFKWGMLHRLTSTLIPLYQRPSPVERVVHTAGKPFVWLFWRLVELLLFIQCGLSSHFKTRESMVSSIPIEVDCFGESTMFPRPEFYRLVRKGVINAQRTEIAECTATGVVLENGKRLAVDVIVFGTGWRTDYGFLPEKVRASLNIEDDGLYLYRHMVHPDVVNIVFIGCNAATLCNILTYSLQARWLVELIKGNHRLPSREIMLRDVEEMKIWKRKWMPFSHARGARLLLHQLHYYDELLKDFGANPRRKTGFFAPLKELIDPYEPNDYRSIVSGEVGEARMDFPRLLKHEQEEARA
jgi:dimethylaniline monooxygenase (N-oxide forming)